MATHRSRAVAVGRRRKRATAEEPAFSPLDLSPRLWLRADMGITESGGDVSAWADQSGNGLDFTQGTGANQPSVSSALGFATVHFTTAEFLSHSGALSSAAQGELFLVQNIAADPPAGTNVTYRGFGSSGASTHVPFLDGVVYDGFASTVRHTCGSSGGALAGTTVYNARSAAGAWSNYIDGVSLFSTGTNTVGWGDPVVLGDNSGNSLVGDMAEVLVFEEILSTENRATLMSYLNARYGL